MSKTYSNQTLTLVRKRKNKIVVFYYHKIIYTSFPAICLFMSRSGEVERGEPVATPQKPSRRPQKRTLPQSRHPGGDDLKNRLWRCNLRDDA